MNISRILREKLWIYPIVTGFILRIWGLTHSAIWHDEGYTMWLLRYNPIEIVQRTARDVHPPAYYLISKPWVEIFGDSTFAIRFLSLLFSLGVIYLVYRIVLELFNKKAALFSSLLIAFSPFMIRFGQEARMYGVVAFFTTLGTFYFIKYLKEKQNKHLVFWLIFMLIAAYTQYYAFFVIVVHWLVMALISSRSYFQKFTQDFRERKYLFAPTWWLTNIAFVVFYAPWFFIAYKQVTRVSGSYWIQPEWITKETVPNNIFHFVTYSHLGGLEKVAQGNLIYWLLLFLIFIPFIYVLYKRSSKTGYLVLLFGLVPMILVYALSELKTPVYQDRYFPFSAVGIFAFWGIAISMLKNKYLKWGIVGVFLAVMFVSGFHMKDEVNHKMDEMITKVEEEAGEDTLVVSGELYTYLDGSYYLDYENSYMYSNERVDGYGETSLFYDKQEEYLRGEEEIKSWQGPVIMYGKENKRYFQEITTPDKAQETIYQDGGLEAVIYR